MSYHKIPIHKHSVSSPYKLQEEALEYIDAVATNNKVMAVQELSDLYGCLETEVAKYGMTIEDLKIMSDLTKEVFSKGTRINQDLLEYLKENYDSVKLFGLGFIQIKCGDINYNFYHKDIPTFNNVEAPHSHQQDFVSEIIKGEVTEILYKVEEGSTKAYCGCGDKSSTKYLNYIFDTTEVHPEGSLYFRDKNTYHSVTCTHGTITKVTKYGEKINAFIISDEEENIELSNLSRSEIWKLIEEVYNHV